MMIGDSASEPNIIGKDSSLCVYICMQLHNTAQSVDVLLWITTSIAHRYETSTDLNCSALVFYLHWLCIVINELIMQHTPGTWLFTYIQEVVGVMERAITHADDPNIKVLFSSSQKAETHLCHIFLASMCDWEAGLKNVFQHCTLLLLSSRLKMEGKHHLTLQLTTQLPEYLFSLQLQAQDK